jgi:hypothetical protein
MLNSFIRCVQDTEMETMTLVRNNEILNQRIDELLIKFNKEILMGIGDFKIKIETELIAVYKNYYHFLMLMDGKFADIFIVKDN